MLQAAEDQRQENHCCWWSLKVITMEYSKTYNTTFCFKENVSSVMKHSESKCLIKNFFLVLSLLHFFHVHVIVTKHSYNIRRKNKTKQNNFTMNAMYHM